MSETETALCAADKLSKAIKVVLESLRQGTPELVEHGVNSARFQSRAEETMAAFRDLKQAMGEYDLIRGVLT